jgi:hypothetical protein
VDAPGLRRGTVTLKARAEVGVTVEPVEMTRRRIRRRRVKIQVRRRRTEETKRAR